MWVGYGDESFCDVHSRSGQSSRGSSVYVGMDTKTGELVSVSEWTLKWRHLNRKLDVDEQKQEEKEAAKYIKQARTS